MKDQSIKSPFQNLLNYSSVPLGITVQGSFEVFREVDGLILPINYRKCGLDMGIWETFSKSSPFTVVAGSRSAFPLMKMGDAAGNERLKKQFHIKLPRAETLLDQFFINRNIANSNNFTEDWKCEMFLFTKETYQKIFEHPDYMALHNLVLKKSLEHSRTEPTRMMRDMVLTNFMAQLAKKNIKQNPYHIGVLEYLIYIATGAMPGFKVVLDSTPLPYIGLVRAYVDHYKLKDYIPTMMHADFFDRKKINSVAYFSLLLPLLLPNNTRNEKSTTHKKELIKLIELIDEFFKELSVTSEKNEMHHLSDLFSEVQFDFFHPNQHLDFGIYSTEDMPKDDPDLIFSPTTLSSNTKFCSSSSFLQGCVRISMKNK